MTLGHLWHQSGSLEIQDICNLTQDSAQRSVEFIGAGRAASSFKEMRPADICLVTTQDVSISDICRDLVLQERIMPGSIVVHCSGFHAAHALSAAQEIGCSAVSAHPVKSFASPSLSVKSFAGTFCGIEGDSSGIKVVEPLLKAIGARTFLLRSESKILYHAATVLVSNYLIALAECGTRMTEAAGIDRSDALSILEPLVRGTVDNLFAVDSSNALTGPISRGDSGVVEAHLNAIQRGSPDLADVYRVLGKFALELAEAQGNATPDSLIKIRQLLVCSE